MSEVVYLVTYIIYTHPMPGKFDPPAYPTPSLNGRSGSFNLLSFLLLPSRQPPRLSYNRPGVSRQGLPLHRSEFVVPVKLGASVLKAHVNSQVVGMAVGPLYRADASFPGPFGSIKHSHRRADTRIMRFQDVRLLTVHPSGPDP